MRFIMESSRIEKILDDLVGHCREAAQGYEAAAKAVDNPDLKHLFETYARQREHFVADLESEIRKRGGEPVAPSTVAEVLHQGWLRLKAALAGHREDTIMTECASGETEALEAYATVPQADLPDDVRQMLERQEAGIREAHDRLQAMSLILAGKPV